MRSEAMFARRFCRIVALAALACGTATAGDLDPNWAERWASPDGRKDEAADVVTDQAGNVYVTGSSGFANLVTWNIVTVSYDPDGVERWQDVYDGGGQDLAAAATLDGNGNLVVLARSNANFLVLRYDRATGQRLAVIEHDGGGSENPTAVVTDPAGNLYLTGSSWPDGVDNQNDYYTVALDPSGNVLWSRRYNGPGAFLFAHDVPRAIALDGRGDVYVTGASNAPGTATGDYYTVKYRGSDGQELWARRYPGGSNEVAYDLVLNDAGDLFVTGGSFQDGGFAYVTIKYDGADGTTRWIAVDRPAACNVATDVELDSAGDVYVTGWADPDCNESNFNDDIATIKHRGTDGAEVWSASFGSPAVGHFDRPHDLALDVHDNVYVTGQNTGLLVLLRYDFRTGAELDVDTVQTGDDEIASGVSLAIDRAQSVIVTGRARNFNTEDRDFYTLKYSGSPAPIFADGFESGNLSSWSQ